jgi:hypothetical protein
LLVTFRGAREISGDEHAIAGPFEFRGVGPLGQGRPAPADQIVDHSLWDICRPGWCCHRPHEAWQHARFDERCRFDKDGHENRFSPYEHRRESAESEWTERIKWRRTERPKSDRRSEKLHSRNDFGAKRGRQQTIRKKAWYERAADRRSDRNPTFEPARAGMLGVIVHVFDVNGVRPWVVRSPWLLNGTNENAEGQLGGHDSSS